MWRRFGVQGGFGASKGVGTPRAEAAQRDNKVTIGIRVR